MHPIGGKADITSDRAPFVTTAASTAPRRNGSWFGLGRLSKEHPLFEQLTARR
jgi:hypothetical protein